MPEIWRKYKARIQVRDKMLGGVPKNPEVLKQWLEIKAHPKLKDPPEDLEKAEEWVESEEKKNWCGFWQNENGLYIELARWTKGMIKKCAKVLKITSTKRGSRDVIFNGLYIKPELFHLEKEKADGYLEHFGEITDARGNRRSIVSRFDYVAKPEIEFEIWVVDTNVLSKDDIEKILVLGQEKGLGAFTSQGYGKYDLLEFDLLK